VWVATIVWMAAAWTAASAGPADQGLPIPQQFTNLQILPKATSQAELLDIMKSFATDLGVRCEHCHVGEGNDLTRFDFAADTRPAKDIARRMIRMTVTINNELLKGIGRPSDEPKVTCQTCHRGNRKPRT
jgi:hypothetical protein